MLDIKENRIKSEKAETFTFKGANRKLNPKINVMLIKQLPITFPKARSINPFLTESILVINSGKLVPKATTVAPIITGGTPALEAKKDADSTMKKEDDTTPNTPINEKIAYFFLSTFCAVSDICSTVSLFLARSYIL
jgi:hypothetical protein